MRTDNVKSTYKDIIEWLKLLNADRCLIISESILDKDMYGIQYLLRNIIELSNKDYKGNFADEYDSFFMVSMFVDRMILTFANLVKYSNKLVLLWTALNRFMILGKRISLKSDIHLIMNDNLYIKIDFDIKSIKNILKLLKKPEILLDRMLIVNANQFKLVRESDLCRLKNKLYKIIGGKDTCKFSELCRSLSLSDLSILLCIQLYMIRCVTEGYVDLRDTYVDHVDLKKAVRHYNSTGKFGYDFPTRAVAALKNHTTKQLSNLIWYIKDFCMIIYIVLTWILKRKVNAFVLCKVNSKAIDLSSLRDTVLNGKNLDYSIELYDIKHENILDLNIKIDAIRLVLDQYTNQKLVDDLLKT